MNHPSFLQLDRFTLGSGDVEISEHLRDCQPCNAHFGRCALPVAVPAWARELEKPRGRKWLWSALALTSLAALPLVMLRSSQPLVTAKGSPSVAVYLRRGEQVSLWDGVPQGYFAHMPSGRAILETQGLPPAELYALTHRGNRGDDRQPVEAANGRSDVVTA